MPEPHGGIGEDPGLESRYESAVAIVGMAGRFPGAADVDGLWRNLLDGVPGLREITDAELDAAGVDPARRADPRYVRVGGPVEGLESFDAAAFGFSPREAETMEPQHRLFLECCWEALEAAGYPPVGPPGRVGVFGGSAFPDYLLSNAAHVADEPGGGMLLAVGDERDSLTSLVAYKLGLRGPSLSVQTFCSTSLVAVHLAVQSLLTFECDMALAGGACLPLPQPAGYLHHEGGISSPTGRVRTFDAAADGTVTGSGVGVVTLKRMTDALADGDVVHAVLIGSAVTNDGAQRAGYAAPGVDGQAAVIETALAVADVKAESVGYVECHANGTPLGDSIEVAALARVFQRAGRRPCVLSSVKPRVGHLDRAAGVTGLMRAALNVRHHVLPATANFERPNPVLASAADRFTVLTADRPWPEGPEPRRAGVSAFGLGGTNAHVVVEEAPPRAERPPRPGPHLLVFSAAEPGTLDAVAERLAAHLERREPAGTAACPSGAPDDLADVAYTLQVSRGHFAARRCVVCRDPADAVAALRDPSRWIDGVTARQNPSVVLVAGDGAPSAWWAALGEAAARTLPGASVRGEDPDAVLGVLTQGLREVGVRVAGAREADGGDALVVTVAPDGPTACGDDAAVWLAGLVGRLWLAGARVDWGALHGGLGRRVTLPTYPFRRSRHWLAPRPAASGAPVAEGRYADPAHWTHVPVWHQLPPEAGDLDERLRATGPWLVLAAEERGEALAGRLLRAGAEVVTVRAGSGFGVGAAGEVTVRPDSVDDLARALGGLVVAPRTVVHAFALATPVGEGAAHFAAERSRGTRSVSALAEALAHDPELPPTRLVLLTAGATAVSGADLRHPEHAGLAGLAPVLAQEHAALDCRHVDLDPQAVPAAAEGRAGRTAAERAAGWALAAVVRGRPGPVAVRGGAVWEPRYERLEVGTAPVPALRAGDRVLVTGGLEGAGLAVARHLAQAYGCRLALTTTVPLPPPGHRDPSGAEEASRCAREVADLERRGAAAVLAMTACPADPDALRAVVHAARDRFGGLDVVVHAADADGPEALESARVGGFHALQEALGDEAFGFRIAFSSLTSVLGGPGQGARAVCGAALDAFALRARLRGAGGWTAIDWDAWSGDGSAPAGYEIAPGDGAVVFERVAAERDRLARVVVSTGPLEPRLTRWVTGTAAPREPDTPRHPRRELSVPYEEPAPGTERVLAQVWAAALGLDRVGAVDDFLELGGHSLLAVQLAARIRSALPAAEVSPATLVRHPTVRSLAAALDDATGAAQAVPAPAAGSGG
ncbi:beta-ketoacyl synthase N-terminal-like domain-containing protein [Streptomyces sp. ICBB 8177]|uniref:beta-ketoacyl synthase N-terminal-like domain-containing protein n=1 Tax=Streptomyces sp. ICBB 8177 TaxID=563922 RepID=UPI001F546BA9|nr:beta-ketoacyl synthase N-terminal-like domain-containing protein [Streptomyces sp. ICBB 8177]